ncbi:cytochrome b561 [Enterobacter sp. R1(2018)]|uniref:cytochrome b561 n=1 Tax=Enterobacter sp. R1(2018) TaxID=2447891 RepID=UPI000EB20F2B|nr:cytochrome b561 [Enterobacter sp. R1(2018)]RKQ39563.1 cytochrome b561 [Enterobacter sp. R1(2018)]
MRSKYTSLQITLHWLVFLLIVGAYCAMELKGFFPRSYRPTINAIHVTCGLSVLVLMVVRLLVRIKYRAPAITPKPHPAITGLSHLVHTIIYLMFIVLPIFGFLTVYFKGHDWSVLGIPMPHAPELDEDRQFTVKEIHEFIANTGYFVIGIHAFAALFHHYIWKDNTLLRMLPGKKDRLS